MAPIQESTEYVVQNEIGKLGAIAIIRTALNFFLSREMREERATTEAEHRVQAHANAVTRPDGTVLTSEANV